MHPMLLEMIVNDRQAAIARKAARAEPRPTQQRPLPRGQTVGLRLDRVHDRPGLEQLAELEGRSLPAGPFVVAEVAGRIVAALPLDGGSALADPFWPSAEVVDLLAMRAAQLAPARSRLHLPSRGFRSLASRG